MNREALARILDRARRAEPPAAADRAAGLPLQALLWALMARWAGMDEAAWPAEVVDRLKDQILDIFRDHPTEGDACFREWRAAHPERRLA
jgi:hypothetical protein